MKNSNASLRSVLDLLHRGSETSGALVLRKIREAQSVDDAVNEIAAAEILLNTASVTGSHPDLTARDE